MIPFNKPFLCGEELSYVSEAIQSGSLSSDGPFTQESTKYFEIQFGMGKVFFTPSCTAALEMCALLLEIKPGDEVIVPSFTFVSSANAFCLFGAKVVFADSSSFHPNIDAENIEKLITSKTKAIVVVHYGGVACDMEKIMQTALKYGIYVVEDAAHAVGAYYESGSKKMALGSIGHLGAISFHVSKNITCGEGGLLIINDKSLEARAEIIREKGTNRSSFLRGEVAAYEWIEKGSSYIASEISLAFLLPQLKRLSRVQEHRIHLWNIYYETLLTLEEKGFLRLPEIPDFARHNAHIFYLLCSSPEQRKELQQYLLAQGIHTATHYLPLHSSPYGKKNFPAYCPNAEYYGTNLLRLPVYYQLKEDEVEFICRSILSFFKIL
ncbi:MAG: dTDP-4-amino-4,6-dideoxygalactose transaminase [Chitinophagales bacterium]|nr:dTDP-4-amino-4,6-dideoxygalactose transaminase [Chitinophagales bacterium]